MCDPFGWQECPSGASCSCRLPFFFNLFCLRHDCCPVANGVGCADNEHCVRWAWARAWAGLGGAGGRSTRGTGFRLLQARRCPSARRVRYHWPPTLPRPSRPPPSQCPPDTPVCDTGAGKCWSADGKTSVPWISKNPAKAATSAADILEAAAEARAADEIAAAGLVRKAKEHFKPSLSEM
jgi:hypothetical protein